MSKPNNIWWGPPKKFSTHFEERKISWLELFYDLVYVIVISRTTQQLVKDVSFAGIIDYMYLFIMIFWGWYNGSQYYDLHGTPGIRTRFMTLWQMMAVAALAVTLSSPADSVVYRSTISIAVLQLYITYLWWSVGIYDKEHRRLNIPYTICYLTALVLIIATLFIPHPYKRIVFWMTLLINYMPPFILSKKLRRKNDDFTFSSSMVERLGLLVIIVFGEVILGVINGATRLGEVSVMAWTCFGLGICIAFALWWIFFSLIADRKSRPGSLRGHLMAVLYIPAVASLGVTGGSFPALMQSLIPHAALSYNTPYILYSISLSVFLYSITLISRFLEYPPEYTRAKNILQPLLICMATVILIFTCVLPNLPLIYYLMGIFVMLLSIIIVITAGWFRVELKRLHLTGNN